MSVRSRILLTEVIIFGALAGIITGVAVAWHNHAKTQGLWFGELYAFPIEVVGAFVAFGVFVALVVYFASRKVNIKMRRI